MTHKGWHVVKLQHKIVQMTLNWPWPILQQCQIWSQAFVWEKGETVDCSDSIVACDFKVSKWTFKNTNGQGYMLAFVLDASDSVFLISSSPKLLGWLKPNYIWSLYGIGE